MLLSAESIRSEIECGSLIVPETIRDYDNRIKFIEGSSFDLEVDRLFVPNPMVPAVLGDNIRKTPDLIEVLPCDFQDPQFDEPFRKAKISESDRRKMNAGWFLSYGKYYVLVSNEETTLTREYLGRLRQRRSYIISGCPVFLTDVAPGYEGTISSGICILHEKKNTYCNCRTSGIRKIRGSSVFPFFGMDRSSFR